MAWHSVDVKIKNKGWGAMMKSSDSVVEFSVSAACKIKAGDAVECGGQTYTATLIEDIAQRGETLVITCGEKSDDKSKAGRASDSSGSEDA